MELATGNLRLETSCRAQRATVVWQQAIDFGLARCAVALLSLTAKSISRRAFGPFEGVFIYAMDIDTGNVVWRNDRMGYLFGRQPHNTEAIGGLAPQGYLVINEGLSREIRAGTATLKFDERREGVIGDIHSMVVADNALFVATRDGRILCFRERGDVAEGDPAVWSGKTTSLATSREASTTAAAVLENASSKHGIAIVAGLSDGSLTKALIESSDYQVVVFDDNADKIERLRRDLDEAGLYGSRAAVIQCDLQKLELAAVSHDGISK